MFIQVNHKEILKSGVGELGPKLRRRDLVG